MSSSAIKKISDEIENLSENEQLLLVNMIIERLINRKESKKLDIRDLRNTGQGTWSKENIKEYIDSERNQWER
jgi:hypothetical protein